MALAPPGSNRARSQVLGLGTTEDDSRLPPRKMERPMLAVAQNHPPGVESRGFKITHPEKVKGLANRLWSGADLGHVKLSQDGLGQRNTGTQKQRMVGAAPAPGAPDRTASGCTIASGTCE